MDQPARLIPTRSTWQEQGSNVRHRRSGQPTTQLWLRFDIQDLGSHTMVAKLRCMSAFRVACGMP